MSANDKHPHGLANGSDQVGRNYMYHNSVAVLAISKEPNPTGFQKTLGLNDFYFGMAGFDFPMGNIQMVGKSQGPMYKGEKPIEAGLAPMFTLDDVAKHAVDFWLSTEDLPQAGQPGHGRQRRQHHAQLHAQQPGAQAEALRQAEVDAQSPGHAPASPGPAQPVHEERDRDRRRGAPGRHLPLRHRSEDLGARHQLQGARAGQSVCGRYQLLPEHRRGQSGADGHGQCDPRRRSSAGTPQSNAEKTPMAQRNEIAAVYTRGCHPGRGAGHLSGGQHDLHQPQYYGLSSTAYGAMFLPQAIMAIGPRCWARA